MGKYRIEKYLEYLNGEDVKLPEPFTKQEKLLYRNRQNINARGQACGCGSSWEDARCGTNGKRPRRIGRWDYVNTYLSLVCARKGREASRRVA